MNWRPHVITFITLLLAIGIIKFIWNNPQVVLYAILGVIVVLAYGALYIIVKAKMGNKDPK